jgi:CMP-N-acetylneuraminic acid synthetase
MTILPNTAWGIVTARGGSKSIPLKNLVPVCGQPMLTYVIKAATKATLVSRIICSTDHQKIAEVARNLGADVTDRPPALSGDDVNTIDVMLDLVETLQRREGVVAEILVLLQPTSLFTTPQQIDDTVSALLQSPDARSSQTVVRVPHQFHAHNQRQMYDDGRDIGWVYPEERARGYNKQTKPAYYAYGNLITTRTHALVEDRTIYGRPSVPVEIPITTAYDLDGPSDLAMAELMIRNGVVDTSWMQ